MHRILVLLASLLSLPLMACGATSVGDECSDNLCGSELMCRKDFPGTFCTRPCTQEGEAGGCPEGSLCTRQFDDLLCTPTCESGGDCREGYECNGVTGSNVKACRIKLP